MTPAFDQIMNDLSHVGYSVSDAFLNQSQVAALASVAHAHQEQGRLVQARTGKTRTENELLRGDSIGWLDERSADVPVLDCLATLEELRRSLNEHLFLNVHEIESHFAIYPPGAVYQRHLDQFATGPRVRQVSLVLYLNEGWLESNGGALRLYLDDATEGHVDVSPVGGRLVLFESARFWHEVLPSDRPRMSLTGWFRTRSGL